MGAPGHVADDANAGLPQLYCHHRLPCPPGLDTYPLTIEAYKWLARLPWRIYSTSTCSSENVDEIKKPGWTNPIGLEVRSSKLSFCVTQLTARIFFGSSRVFIS